MTALAQRDEILFAMISAAAAEDLMMNLEMPHASTLLTSPIIPAQNSQSELL
jgi:hypothetical protein